MSTEILPLYTTTDQKLHDMFLAKGLKADLLSDESKCEDFFRDHWIHQNQDIYILIRDVTNEIQIARKLEEKIREIGGVPYIKLQDFHFKNRVERASTSNELIEAIRRAYTKQRFKPHNNPLTMELEEVKPKFLLDAHGRPLLYPGAVHFIYGQPLTLKSMLMHSLVNKHDIRFIDFENTYPILRQRLLTMGVDPKDGEKFDKPYTIQDLDDRKKEYLETKPEIVVFDSMANLLRMFEYSQDSNDDVTDIFVKFINPLRDAGVSVVIIDHLPKDDNSSEYPIGAQAKKQQSDVMYLMRRVRGSSSVDMFVTKDRNHQITSRCDSSQSLIHYGNVRFEGTDGNMTMNIHPEILTEIGGLRLGTLDSKLWFSIIEFIQNNDLPTKTAIRNGVTGKSSRIDDAVYNLEELGYVGVSKIGTANVFKVLKPLPNNTEPLK